MGKAGTMQIHLWRYIRMYNAVGIDVSKGKSTVAVLQPGGVFIHKPLMSHTQPNVSPDFLNTSVHWTVTQGLSWSVPADTMNLWQMLYIMPACLFLLSIRISLKTLTAIHYARSNQTLPMPEKSPAILLTTGLNCVNMGVWIIHAPS